MDNYPKSGSFSASTDVQIYYEDTDFSGYVYHSNYLKYFERAREHILGPTELKRLYELGVHYVVAEANLKYKAAANFADILTIETTVSFTTSPMVHFMQNALKNGAVIVEGDLKLVVVNSKGKPIKLPKEILESYAKKIS